MYNLNMQHTLRFSCPVSTCGFISGNVYEVEITEADPAGYFIKSKYNATADEEVDIQIYLSSEKSVMRYFTEAE